MAAQYYYLVAGLADLAFDEAKSVPPYAEAAEEIESWVQPEDAELVRLMRTPYDNHNLITILESKQRPFDVRGCYSRAELEQEIKTPDILPDHMGALVAAFREGRAAVPGLVLEDQLSWLFYAQVCDHPNEFIREYFTFERDLRNLLAVAAVRQGQGHLSSSQVTPSGVLVGQGEAAERMSKSTAPDLGVGGILSWSERVLALPRSNPVEFERAIDRLRWDMLDGLTALSSFGIETLCAFTVKLGIVHRWRSLDAESGRQHLGTLSSGLLAGYTGTR